MLDMGYGDLGGSGREGVSMSDSNITEKYIYIWVIVCLSGKYPTWHIYIMNTHEDCFNRTMFCSIIRIHLYDMNPYIWRLGLYIEMDLWFNFCGNLVLIDAVMDE